MRSQVQQLPVVCLPSKSCRKNISPVLMTEEFFEVLKIITFLQFVHASLKEGYWLGPNYFHVFLDTACCGRPI